MKRIISCILIFAMVFISIVGVGNYSIATAATKSRVKTTDLRYWGDTRYDTSFAVADELYKQKGKFDNVIIAYGDNFPDALSGGYLAKKRNAPILLINQKQESRATSYIKKYMKTGGTVYILGGTAVVRKQYEASLKQKGYKVKRLAGQTAVDTNLEILKNCAKGADALLIATRKHYADSLSGSSVGLPLMIVGDTLTKNQKAWLKSCGIKKFYILGGTGAVKASIADELKPYGSVKRVWGQTRWDTSYEIAKTFFKNAKVVTLVTGNHYADGLSGAPLAMYYNSPIILVSEQTKAWKLAHNYVVDRKIVKDITIGGTAAVKPSTVKNVMEQYETKEEITSHTHSYSSAWKYDKTYHWHECTAGDGAVSGKAKHNWEPVYKTIHHDAEYKNVNHPAETKQVWVVDVPAQEAVYETRDVYEEQFVGYVIVTDNNLNETKYTFYDYNEFNAFVKQKLNEDNLGVSHSYAWENVKVGTETVCIKDAVAEQGHYETQTVKKAWTEKVLVKAAWDEQVVDYYTCSCGKRK